MDRFETERGDILLAMQCVLANEAMSADWLPGAWSPMPAPGRPRAVDPAAPRPDAPRHVPGPEVRASATRPEEEPRGVSADSRTEEPPSASGEASAQEPGEGSDDTPAEDLVELFSALPVERRKPIVEEPAAETLAPPTPSEYEPLVDPETGVGTALSLRRDVNREMSWRSAQDPPFLLLELQVTPVDSSVGLLPGEAGDAVRCLIEVAPFVMRGRDRIYRTGTRSITAMMWSSQAEAAEPCRERLEEAVQAPLQGRALPPIRLIGRVLDVSTLVDRATPNAHAPTV